MHTLFRKVLMGPFMVTALFACSNEGSTFRGKSTIIGSSNSKAANAPETDAVASKTAGVANAETKTKTETVSHETTETEITPTIVPTSGSVAPVPVPTANTNVTVDTAPSCTITLSPATANLGDVVNYSVSIEGGYDAAAANQLVCSAGSFTYKVDNKETVGSFVVGNTANNYTLQCDFTVLGKVTGSADTCHAQTALNLPLAPTYSWHQSGWSVVEPNSWTHVGLTACSATCGGGLQTDEYVCNSASKTQTRVVYCQRDTGVQVDDSFCLAAGTRPAISQNYTQKSCSGTDPTVNNKQCNTQVCAAPISENGVCASLAASCGEPSTSSLCTKGSPTSVNPDAASNSYTWKCNSTTGGTASPPCSSNFSCPNNKYRMYVGTWDSGVWNQGINVEAINSWTYQLYERTIDDKFKLVTPICSNNFIKYANAGINVSKSMTCCPDGQVSINGDCTNKANAGEYCYASSACKDGLNCSSNHKCVSGGSTGSSSYGATAPPPVVSGCTINFNSIYNCHQ